MTGQERQRAYYESDARSYDARHIGEGDEHGRAATMVAKLAEQLECRSILDVGTGTGRGMNLLSESLPDRYLVGVEPVRALLEIAAGKAHSPNGRLIQAVGEALPFQDEAFDAVCSFGVLHHVRNPNLVVSEMARVARRAVFISDSNRFGQGSLPKRLFKRFLRGTHLWGTYDFIRTKGRRYQFSEGDGIYYSYSVYDSRRTLARKVDLIDFYPTDAGGELVNPFLNAGHVLMWGIKTR